MRLSGLLLGLFGAATLAGCGSKTGLRVPDVVAVEDVAEDFDAGDVVDATDVVDARDVPDVGDVCIGVPQALERFTAEVIFVIDRSGSMNDRTSTGQRRWEAMTTALGSALPTVDFELWTGLLRFPGGSVVDGTSCGVISGLDIPPRPRNATNVLNVLQSTVPNGGTPTYDALFAAFRYFDNNPPVGRVRGRFLVLATDGGPNCNEALNGATCVCTNARGCAGTRGNLSCLDDTRTAALLRQFSANGVDTFVIGALGNDTTLSRTLNTMAIAGGQPRPASLGPTRYYPAEDAAGFTSAFRDITTALARCRYVTNPFANPNDATVRVGGATVVRDRDHVNGWDWTRPEAGEFVLYGAACEASQRAPVSLVQGCSDAQ